MLSLLYFNTCLLHHTFVIYILVYTSHNQFAASATISSGHNQRLDLDQSLQSLCPKCRPGVFAETTLSSIVLMEEIRLTS